MVYWLEGEQEVGWSNLMERAPKLQSTSSVSLASVKQLSDSLCPAEKMK